MPSILLFAALLLPLQAAVPLPWELLALTTYSNQMEEDGNYSLKPNFPAVLEQFEGKEVEVTGYMVPMDVSAKKYALSKNPFKSCFFCGNAGPETVMGLQFSVAPDRFVTDAYVTVRGKLRLNRKGHDLFFTLTNCSIE